MNRIVIVSNRVVTQRQASQAGGLAVAIADTMRDRSALWFGWSGSIDADTRQPPRLERFAGNSSIAVLPLTADEHRSYYLGYANSVLWPVFHNRVDLAQFEAGYFAAYSEVNRRFAEALRPLLRPDDLIWVHDYHFVPMAQYLRSLGVTNRIGFFLHIPFPPSQAFLTLPEHLQLAHAFAAYDLVGLQTTTDLAHMIDYLGHGAEGRLLQDGRMRVGHRLMRLTSIPVGIDPHYFNAPTEPTRKRPDMRRIIGVDRLDYTKGLPQKFRGFGHLLQDYATYRNHVMLTQIAAPTRESLEAYSDIRKELESLSGAINGSFSDADWVPIHYINRSVSRAKLLPMYRSADVGLVTPLRDGMNLVAKEYIAAQNPNDPGVLILSRFAGAAEDMSDALIVNPYNIDEIARAIDTALRMPALERCRRYDSLMAHVRAADSRRWADNFLGLLEATRDPDPDPLVASSSDDRIRRALLRMRFGATSDSTSPLLLGVTHH